MDQEFPNTDADDDLATDSPSGDIDPSTLGDDVDGMRQQLEEANDRALRSQAELDNFRKRTFRELEAERRYAAMPVLRDLLPVIDNIQRAIEAAGQAHDAGSLLAGVEMVAKQLIGGLEQHGCKRIQANAGDPFDPAVHEAVSQMPSNQFAAGQIIQATQPGYLLHDRVIRPAQVIVSSGPE